MNEDASLAETDRRLMRLAEIEAADRRGRRWAGARWWLLGLVVATNLLAFLAAPVRSDSAGFLADLTTGRATWVQSTTFARSDPPGLSWSPVGNDDYSRLGTSVRWGTRGGPTFEADLSNLGFLTDSSGTVDTDEIDLLRSARATARAAGHTPPVVAYVPDHSLDLWAGRAAFAAFAVLFLSLAAGPQPRRFTKWGTFWVLCLPVGLGAVWLLLRDAPWSTRMAALAPPWPGRTGLHPDGVVHRRGGWIGLLVLIVVGGLLGQLLREAHTWLLDHHTAGSDTWRLVDVRGHVTTLTIDDPPR